MKYSIIVLEKEKKILIQERERIIKTILPNTVFNHVCHVPIKKINQRIEDLKKAIGTLNLKYN